MLEFLLNNDLMSTERVEIITCISNNTVYNKLSTKVSQQITWKKNVRYTPRHYLTQKKRAECNRSTCSTRLTVHDKPASKEQYTSFRSPPIMISYTPGVWVEAPTQSHDWQSSFNKGIEMTLEVFYVIQFGKFYFYMCFRKRYACSEYRWNSGTLLILLRNWVV